MMIEKPKVFINCAMSLDGKLSTYERCQVRISNKADLERVDKLRADSDAVVVGMKTVLFDDPKLNVKSDQLREMRLRRGMPANPFKVAVGCVNKMRLNSEFLDYGGPKLIFTTARSDPEKIEKLREKAEVYVIGEDHVDLDEVLRVLAGKNVRTVMIEGGGTLNFEFLKAGLVDDIYVAVGPRILGGKNAPTVADGEGFSSEDALDLELIDCEKLEDNIILSYRVLGVRKTI